MGDTKVYRVFIGGLFHSVTEEDLRERFQYFGGVTNVTVIRKKDSDGIPYKTFGYINLQTDESTLTKCFAIYGKSKWNGFELKVQLAKDDFMKRLRKEWENPNAVNKSRKRKNEEPIKSYNEIIKNSHKMRKSVPGTLIAGEKNWVIGKYGRPLPIVSISKCKGKKPVKIDPSKYCHCLRKLNVEDRKDSKSIVNLTWPLSVIVDSPKKNKEFIKKNHDVTKEKEKYRKNKDSYKLPKILIQEKSATEDKSKFQIERSFIKAKEQNENIEKIYTSEFNAKDKVKTQLESKSALSILDAQFTENETNIDIYNDDIIREVNTKCIGLGSCIVDQLYKKDFTVNHCKRSSDQQFTTGLISYADDNRNINCGDNSLEGTDNKDTATEKSFRFDLGDLKANQSNPLPYNYSFGESEFKVVEPFTDGFDSNVERYSISATESDTFVKLDQDVLENPFDFTLNDLKVGQSNPVSSNYSFSESEFKIVEPWVGGSVPNNESDMRSTTESDNATESDEYITDTPFSFTLNNLKAEESNPVHSKYLFSESEFRIVEPLIDDSGGDKSDMSSNTELDATATSGEDVIENLNRLSSGDLKQRKINAVSISYLCGESKFKSVGSWVNNSGSNNKSNTGSITESSSSIDLDVTDFSELKAKDGTSPSRSLEPKRHSVNSKALTIEKAENNAEKTTKFSALGNLDLVQKHAFSDEARKKSLEKRSRELENRNELIKNALKNVDCNTSNRSKIIFSDADSDFEEMSTAENEENNENSKDMYASLNIGKANLGLLKDDSDSDTNDHFKVKRLFQGNEGEKLFKMQQKFGGDQRFRMDERFAVKDNDIHMEKQDTADHQDTEKIELKEIEKERERSLSMLENVLGQYITNEKSDKCTTKFDRYDPSKNDHEKYQIIENEESNVNEIAKIENIKEKSKVDVTKETYYEVNPSIKKLFSDTSQSSGFSFLDENRSKSNIQQFKFENSIKTDVSVERKIEESNCQKEKNNFQSESSVENKESKNGGRRKRMFFVTGNANFKLGKSFRCKESFTVIEEQWKRIRPDLVENYKKKSKDALRRLRKLKERKYGRS